MASNRLHTEPVNGRTTAVGPERARSDPALIPGHVEKADNFVDLEDAAQWIDCFRLHERTSPPRSRKTTTRRSFSIPQTQDARKRQVKDDLRRHKDRRDG